MTLIEDITTQHPGLQKKQIEFLIEIVIFK